MTEEFVDVLVCGSGSAGLCTALWLAKRGLSCKIIEKTDGPLERGKADGVQCRTVEIFESFGLSYALLRESYHVLEVCFWTPSKHGSAGIHRSNRCADTPPGLSHLPHVILNQARINGLFLDAIRELNGQEVEYGCSVQQVAVDESTAHDHYAYSVTAVVNRRGHNHTYRARYLVGSDGAHSSVRKSLGIRMLGDSSDSVWGVMDIIPLTNFPDIRKKCVVKTSSGSILIIPREGGVMARFYVELPAGTRAQDVSLDDLIASVQKILSPYHLHNTECIWWSAYSIGQRLADQFTRFNRVFLTGDACHTHSPKAGQGMNTSLQDGYNLGWKLAAVLKKEAKPSLLQTYVTERQEVAEMLINFDREFAKGFSSRSSCGDAEAFTKQFMDSAVFTTGLAARYSSSMITAHGHCDGAPATKLPVGMRLPTTMVTRHCDARTMQLIEAFESTGSWRVLIFAGNILDEQAASRLQRLAEFLQSEPSLMRFAAPPETATNALVETIVVLAGDRADIETEMLPEVFRPASGKFQIPNIHQVFVDEGSYNSAAGHAYQFYGVTESKGAMAIVRPDQHISAVLDLEDHVSLGGFFAGVFTSGSARPCGTSRYSAAVAAQYTHNPHRSCSQPLNLFSLQA